MLKKTITYNDLDGNPVTEDFYFNLSKAEIAEMELSHQGGWSEHLNRIIESKDGGEIMAAFKKIITDAIGRRSEDGRRFVKSEEITNEFLQTDAYSALFMELVVDADAAAKFITAIMPADMVEDFESGRKLVDVSLPDGEDEVIPAYIRENRDPTREELQAMSKDELQQAFEFKAKRPKS